MKHDGDTDTITRCKALASWALVIASIIEGNPVTSSGEGAFFGCNHSVHNEYEAGWSEQGKVYQVGVSTCHYEPRL